MRQVSRGVVLQPKVSVGGVAAPAQWMRTLRRVPGASVDATLSRGRTSTIRRFFPRKTRQRRDRVIGAKHATRFGRRLRAAAGHYMQPPLLCSEIVLGGSHHGCKNSVEGTGSTVEYVVRKLHAANMLPWQRATTAWEQFVADCMEPPAFGREALRRFTSGLSRLPFAVLPHAQLAAIAAVGFRPSKSLRDLFWVTDVEHLNNYANALECTLDNIPNHVDRATERAACLDFIVTTHTVQFSGYNLERMQSSIKFDGPRRAWLHTVVSWMVHK